MPRQRISNPGRRSRRWRQIQPPDLSPRSDLGHAAPRGVDLGRFLSGIGLDFCVLRSEREFEGLKAFEAL
jgi:hypothetical protein